MFSQARWSGKVGGRIAARGRRPPEMDDCRRAPANTASNNRATRHEPRTTACLRLLPYPAGAPEGRITGRAKGLRLAAAGFASNSRFPARGVPRLIFDVALFRISSRNPSGARRNFATGALHRGPPPELQPGGRRPLPRLASQILFDQNSVTVSHLPTERACGRRPCRTWLPCVQLVASRFSGRATSPGRK